MEITIDLGNHTKATLHSMFFNAVDNQLHLRFFVYNLQVSTNVAQSLLYCHLTVYVQDEIANSGKFN